MSDKNRAWKDARQDYIIEQARIRSALWKLFLTFLLLGIGLDRFFRVEIYD